MAFQQQKTLVSNYYDAISQASSATVLQQLKQYTSPTWLWRGYHPFNEQIGAEQVADIFWQPLLSAMASLQRRQDIFFAGRNEIDGFQSVWVVSMGHLVGLFDKPFLDIPATQKMAFLRYCEFNRVEQGKISETAFFFDLPHFIAQAGVSVFNTQRGAQLVQPGPQTHDGLCFGKSDPNEGQKTLALINKMIVNIGQWQSTLPVEEELALSWHDDMMWWGPTGIGATYTIERYAKQHAMPFRATLAERSATRHVCRVAEGSYGGFFGWPNFTAVNRGGCLGIPPSDVRGEFRVIDIYRRAGEKLAENWVFIDLLHWMKLQGITPFGNFSPQNTEKSERGKKN